MSIKQTMWVGACALIGWHGMGFIIAHAIVKQ
jgi:hypothetical protein